MTGQFVSGCRALAEIVSQRREAHFKVVTELLGLVQHHHDVQSRVDFRMPAFRLRDTEKCIQLGKQHAQCAAGAEHFEVDARVRPGERELRFLPDPVRHERIDFASLDHAMHEPQRFSRDSESEV